MNLQRYHSSLTDCPSDNVNLIRTIFKNGDAIATLDSSVDSYELDGFDEDDCSVVAGTSAGLDLEGQPFVKFTLNKSLGLDGVHDASRSFCKLSGKVSALNMPTLVEKTFQELATILGKGASAGTRMASIPLTFSFHCRRYNSYPLFWSHAGPF